MAARTGRSGDGASSSRPRGPGVSEQDGRDYIEVRARDETNRKYKINVSGFGGNREWLKMAHDAAKWCNLGVVAYSTLDHTKLHYPEKRQFLSGRFREDIRMADLASLHRAKRASGEVWTKEMKETLRKLAADALQWIINTEQGAPAPQPVDGQMREVASDALLCRSCLDRLMQHYTVQEATAALPVGSQSMNGNTDGSNAAVMLNIAWSIGRELGARQDNWHNIREAQQCMPLQFQWLGDNQAASSFPSEDPDLRVASDNDTAQGAAAAQPVDSGNINFGHFDSQWSQANLDEAMAFREVASDALRPINDTTQGAAAVQPVDSQMREVASDAIQNLQRNGQLQYSQWAAGTSSTAMAMRDLVLTLVVPLAPKMVLLRKIGPTRKIPCEVYHRNCQSFRLRFSWIFYGTKTLAWKPKIVN